MKMHGWGRYPVVDAQVYSPTSQANLQNQLSSLHGDTITPQGLGRSYGDSSLEQLG